MKYTINHAYSSRRDGQQFGPWQAGDVVELEPADAEWVNRDSPGCLAEAKAKAKAETKADDGGERQQQPTADRQHRGGRNRSS